MGKITDKIKNYGTIAAIAVSGLFASSPKSQTQNTSNSPQPVKQTAVAPQSTDDIIFIDSEQNTAADTSDLYYDNFVQVDTVYDASVVEQVRNGTYEGSNARYDFSTNTTTVHYFAQADGTDANGDEDYKEAIKAHETGHFKSANLYGYPHGIISPEQVYSVEIAEEFHAYFEQTMMELNKSAFNGEVIGMNHEVNSDFGDALANGLLQKYISGAPQEVDEVIEIAVNSIFEKTYHMMNNSKLYQQQISDAIHKHSDQNGVPEEIRRENFEKAIQNLFTYTVVDDEDNTQTINLYEYLTPENRALLETVAPQFKQEIAEVTKQNNEQIKINTAKRLAEWDEVAEKAATERYVSKAEILHDLENNFYKDSRQFTFPSAPQPQASDAEHHVSEAMVAPEYNSFIYVNYAAVADDYLADNVQTTTNPNELALHNALEKMHNLQLRKGEISQASSNFSNKTDNTMPRFASNITDAVYRKPEELYSKKRNDRS